MKAERKAAKGGLAQRLLTAAVAVPILLWIILAGPPWAWLLVILFAAVVGLYEFYAMTISPDDVAVRAMGVTLGALIVPMVYYTPSGMMALAGLMTAVLAMMLAVLFSFRVVERAAGAMVSGLAGLFYVGFLLSFFTLLRRDPGELGRYWILMLLAVIWAGDTGAYFAGRLLGRHRMALVVSPKKTWEGAVGGVVASVGAGLLVVAVTPLDFTLPLVLALTVPAAVLGQLGDLCESLLKRSCGVKDSGRIIYGHGGILDRIDALLFAGPYFYFFYRFAVSGTQGMVG